MINKSYILSIISFSWQFVYSEKVARCSSNNGLGVCEFIMNESEARIAIRTIQKVRSKIMSREFRLRKTPSLSFARKSDSRIATP